MMLRYVLKYSPILLLKSLKIMDMFLHYNGDFFAMRISMEKIEFQFYAFNSNGLNAFYAPFLFPCIVALRHLTHLMYFHVLPLILPSFASNQTRYLNKV